MTNFQQQLKRRKQSAKQEGLALIASAFFVAFVLFIVSLFL